MNEKMRGVISAFVSWALGENRLTYDEESLYDRFARCALSAGTDGSHSRFAALLRRLADKGVAVRVLRDRWAFPDADVFVRLREHPEAPEVIIQDALLSLSRACHIGGFDILYREACITVPPKRMVIFSSGDEFYDLSADLRRFSGASIRLDAFVVPNPRAGTGRGIIRTEAEGFPCFLSDTARAEEDARWLVNSEWGKRTGFYGQRCLLEQMDQERIDDEMGL